MMVELHSTEVEGVRTYWVETGRPTLAATLMFRQGVADEQFTTSGWTHLLEHLSLHGRGGGALSVNGSVSPLMTSFLAHGPAADVSAHLRAVCSWLREPDLERLDHERKVLVAESAARGTGEVGTALTWRYGARGPGLVGHSEPGLVRADPDLLRELAGGAFARGNAALMLDGPPPAGLVLPLPDGDLQPIPPAVPCDDRRPASYLVPTGVVLSGVVDRSMAATFLARWLEQELRVSLRDEAGAAYAPWSHYEAVDDAHAVVFGGSDVAVEHQSALVQDVLGLVLRLKSGPDKSTTLDRMVSEYVQAVGDPYQAYGVAVRAGHFGLRGEAPQSLEEILDEARSVSVGQVAESARLFAASLLVGLPPGAEQSPELPRLVQALPGTQEGGSRYRSASAPADKSVLSVGRETVSVRNGDDGAGVLLDQVVGLLQAPDGGRQLVDVDGWSVNVEPTLWRRGQRAVEEIDALVPADLHLPQPARDPEGVPKPASLLLRYRQRLAVTAAGAAGFGVLVLVIASDASWLAGPVAISLYMLASGYRKSRR